MRGTVSATVVLLFALAALPSTAHTQEVNPNYSMSIVGPDTFQVAAGTVLADRFTVRVVDRQGTPVPNIDVWFYPNCTITVPEQPPPPCFQGTFIGVAPDQLVRGMTDQNGVAVAPPYQVEGPIDIVAGAYDWNDGSANDVIGWPPLVLYFHVNHRAGDPPDFPGTDNPGGTPNGTPAPFAAPTLSTWALIALAILVAGFGVVRGRSRETR